MRQPRPPAPWFFPHKKSPEALATYTRPLRGTFWPRFSLFSSLIFHFSYFELGTSRINFLRFLFRFYFICRSRFLYFSYFSPLRLLWHLICVYVFCAILMPYSVGLFCAVLFVYFLGLPTILIICQLKPLFMKDSEKKGKSCSVELFVFIVQRLQTVWVRRSLLLFSQFAVFRTFRFILYQLAEANYGQHFGVVFGQNKNNERFFLNTN